LTSIEHTFDTGCVTTAGFPGPPDGSHQILNSDWPKYPNNFVERPPILVWVRVEWDSDAEQWCPGVADRWNKWFVRVRFEHEPRAAQGLTWVKPHDVRRRNPDGTERGTETARREAAVPGS
jgi:hypothetical protein